MQVYVIILRNARNLLKTRRKKQKKVLFSLPARAIVLIYSIVRLDHPVENVEAKGEAGDLHNDLLNSQLQVPSGLNNPLLDRPS